LIALFFTLFDGFLQRMWRLYPWMDCMQKMQEQFSAQMCAALPLRCATFPVMVLASVLL